MFNMSIRSLFNIKRYLPYVYMGIYRFYVNGYFLLLRVMIWKIKKCEKRSMYKSLRLVYNLKMSRCLYLNEHKYSCFE